MFVSAMFLMGISSLQGLSQGQYILFEVEMMFVFNKRVNIGSKYQWMFFNGGLIQLL